MPEALSIDRASTAVLIMDYQAPILDRIAESKPLLERAAGVLAAARHAGLPVIYVVVGFRPGYPEISDRNVAFGTVKQMGRFLTDAPHTGIHHAVAPVPDDVIVVKHRVGAFFGTDLDMILRAQRRDTLALLGISTSGVVLSTIRHAADADYRVVVLSDCCADTDAQVHACLMEKVFPRQATMSTAAEFVQAVGA